jgi:hypothetical protein
MSDILDATSARRASDPRFALLAGVTAARLTGTGLALVGIVVLSACSTSEPTADLSSSVTGTTAVVGAPAQGGGSGPVMVNGAEQCEPGEYWRMTKRGISTRSIDYSMACR